MKAPGALQFSRRALLRAAGSTLLVPTFLKQAFAQFNRSGEDLATILAALRVETEQLPATHKAR